MSASKRDYRADSPDRDNPGPGSYDHYSRSNAPSHSMGGKGRDASYNDNPGPGSYDANKHGVNQGIALPKERRGGNDNRHLIENPGPGSYQHYSQMSGPAYQLGGKSRDAKYNDHPGPGQYEEHQHPGKPKAPAYNFGGDQRSKELSPSRDNPGPGSYDQQLRQGGPQYSLGNKHRDLARDDHPGPGHYE